MFKQQKNKYVALTCIPILLLFIGVAMAISVAPSLFDRGENRHAVEPGNPVVQRDKESEIKAVKITIRSDGFEPSEIEYPAKPFLLAVDNQSSLETMQLQLHRLSGSNQAEKVRELKLSLKNVSKRQIVDLQPGKYKLTETTHPEWECLITITPH